VRVVYVSFYGVYPPVSGAASVTWNCGRFTAGEVTLIQLGSTCGDEFVDGVRRHGRSLRSACGAARRVLEALEEVS
jgi:hypothetical protein